MPTAASAPDRQIAGIGLGTTEQFDPSDLAVARQTRAVANAEPPSTLALIAGMIAFPLVAGVTVVLVLRRRRQALIA